MKSSKILNYNMKKKKNTGSTMDPAVQAQYL